MRALPGCGFPPRYVRSFVFSQRQEDDWIHTLVSVFINWLKRARASCAIEVN